MKNVLIVAIGLGLGLAVLEARADTPQVICDGSESGGSGPRQYAYEVDGGGLGIMEFMVGTNDLALDSYTNLLIPENWSFAVEEQWINHSDRNKTGHGEISPGLVCWCATKGRVRWWTEDTDYALGSFTFGYNHPWVSEDVGWGLSTSLEARPPELPEFYEDWQSPVGMGLGPVHDPLGPLPGDVNEDGFIEGEDLTTVITYWGQSSLGREFGDLDGSGTVDGPDYTEVLTYWGTGSPPEPSGIPEPGTLGLLLAGSLALMGRKAKSA